MNSNKGARRKPLGPGIGLPGPSGLRGPKDTKPMPSRPKPISKKSEDDDDTHIRLLEWGKTMGFMPGGKFTKTSDFPPAEDMKKLCRVDMKPIWEHIMKCVRPKQEVAEIRRVLTERRRRQRGDSPARRSELEVRKESLELELARRKTQVADGKALLKQLWSDCDSGVREYERLQHAAEQDQLKTNLLNMKTELLNREVRLMEDYVKMADFMMSGLTQGKGAATRVKPRADPRVVGKLRECLARLAEFHEKAYGRSNVEDQVSWGHEDKAELQRFVLDRTVGLTTEETWRALMCLQDEHTERTKVMRDSTLDQEEDYAEVEVRHAEILLHELETMCLRTRHQVTLAERENQALSLRLDQTFQECWDLILRKLDSTTSLNQTSVSNSALVEEWLEKSLMSARLKASMKELDRVLLELRAETERLLVENQMDEPARLEMRLRREELGKMDVRANYHLSVVAQVTREVSTVLADIDGALADPRLADSARTTSQLLARRHGLIGQEIGLFCDFPLDSIDYVTLPTGERKLRSSLLVNLARRTPACGIALKTIDQVVLDLHRKKIYANQLAWALEDRATLETIPVYDHARAREAETRMNADTRSLVNRMMYDTDECEARVDSLVQTHASYHHHPVQHAIPEDATAGGLTLVEWKVKYDEAYGRLGQPGGDVSLL